MLSMRESLALTLRGRLNDRMLMAVLAVLLLMGLVMVASSSVAVAERATGGELYYFVRQLAFAGLGLGAAAVMYCIPMQHWERASFVLLALALVLLIAVLIPGVGVVVNGARRWIDLGPVNLQASEPARLCLFLYMAGYVTRHQAQVQNRIRGLIKPLLPLGFAAILLLAEPDFGATAVLLAVTGILLFVAGARLSHLLLLAVVGIGTLGLLIVSSSYRLTRLISFTNPWDDPFNTGFQLTQSLIAIGRGEWLGVGLGNSIQKLLYLPETHTDFLFAIYAEEFGLLGSALLIVLFGVVVWRGLAIARAAEAHSLFNALVAYALTAWIGLQAFINMAVNMGVLPTKGLTMPFFSYGGSSLLTMCAAAGLMLRVDRETRLEAGAAGTPDRGRRK